MKAPKRKYKKENTEMELARFENPDIGFEYHGQLVMKGNFDYFGTCQGMCYVIDIDFIKRFLNVFEVDCISNCTSLVWVEHNRGTVFRIISPNGEHEFDVHRWSEDLINRPRHCRNCDAVLADDEGQVCKKCWDKSIEKVFKDRKDKDELYMEDDLGDNLK